MVRNDFSANLIWREFCYASLILEPESQKGSGSRKVLGRWSPQSMHEYNCATAIAICLVTHPRTWETDSSSFLAMSQLNFLSSTCASSPSILSMERTNGEKCIHLLWQCLPCFSFSPFSQQARRLLDGSLLLFIF